jgi:hypothetical protein
VQSRRRGPAGDGGRTERRLNGAEQSNPRSWEPPALRGALRASGNGPVGLKRAEVIEIMERLEALGATAILETTITNCRL